MVQEECIYIGHQKSVAYAGIVSMRLIYPGTVNLMFVMGSKSSAIMLDI
jgi:hypothetical protein